MSRRIGRGGAAVVVAFGLSLGTPMPAAHALAGAHLALEGSTNQAQAGYFARGLPVAVVSDRFRVPAVSCSGAAANSAMAAGAFVFNSSNGEPTAAAVIAKCSNGSASYLGVLEISGNLTFTRFLPAPGNLIQVTARQTPASAKASMRDITLSKVQSSSGSGATNGSVFLGIDTLTNGTSPLPVPTFVKLRFLLGAVNGMTVRASGATAADLQESTVVDIHTGKLNPRGRGWVEFWHANS